MKWSLYPGNQLVQISTRRELDRAVPVWVLTDGQEVVILRSNQEAMRPENYGENFYKS